MVKPGPASSVEEHSLRKFSFTRGPWFESRRGLLFSDAIFSNFAQMFDGNSNYRTSYINHATLPIGKSCCDNLYWVKRNVALKIGPMEREALRGGLTKPYTLLRNSTTVLLLQILQPATSSLRRSHLRWMKSNVTGQVKDGT